MLTQMLNAKISLIYKTGMSLLMGSMVMLMFSVSKILITFAPLTSTKKLCQLGTSVRMCQIRQQNFTSQRFKKPSMFMSSQKL